MINKEVRDLALKIWEYNFLQQPLEKSDCILVLCSHDLRMADFAAKLFLQNWAPYLAFSGGLSGFTAKIFDRSEAEVFADKAIELGVPAHKILIEKNSTNTGENLQNSARLFEERNLNFRSFVLVQKPNMLRRVFASAKKQWPDKKFCVASHDISFDSAPHHHVTEEMFVHELVGDLQRVKIYPEIGHQIYQPIPEDVWNAYEQLVALGFTGRMAK